VIVVALEIGGVTEGSLACTPNALRKEKRAEASIELVLLLLGQSPWKILLKAVAVAFNETTRVCKFLRLPVSKELREETKERQGALEEKEKEDASMDRQTDR
jgi:hypothetical protein